MHIKVTLALFLLLISVKSYVTIKLFNLELLSSFRRKGKYLPQIPCPGSAPKHYPVTPEMILVVIHEYSFRINIINPLL